jgi:hypothetical protein
MSSRFLVLSVATLVLAAASSTSLLAVAPATVPSPFYYSFNVPGSLEEAASMASSTSPYWWLSSGGRLVLDGTGDTLHDELPANDYWRLLYAANNPQDTDQGYHPQNLFRLVTRSRWRDFRQQVYFRIDQDNLSASPNRNASNGVFLLNRYQDQYNLYYTGIRVDGAAVIKKKKQGTYYTMAYQKVFPGTYNHETRPNLLPKGAWLGITSEVMNLANGSVRIRVHVNPGNGAWVLVFDIVDDGAHFGGAPFAQQGYAGLRTDFMDVSFENYLAQTL